MLRPLLALLALATGCFSPDLGDHPYLCGSEEPRCPSGYACQARSNTCVQSGLVVGDGGPADVAIVSDARLVDGGGDARVDAGPDGRPADAGPDARPPDGGCAPVGGTSCDGDVLLTCTNSGITQTACAAGCDSIAPPACFILAPQLLPPNTCRASSSAAPSFPNGTTTIDTDACDEGEVVTQDNGAPALCVFRYRSLTLAAGATLIFTGSRVPGLVTTGDMMLLGRIDVSASGPSGGPGSRIMDESQGGSGLAQTPAGGGGGGGATSGGKGGPPAAGVAGGGAPGIARGDPSTLQAGAYGGPGGDRCGFAGCPRSGGGAGGALYLVACGTATLGGVAVIDASGGGGPGGEEGGPGEAPGGGDGGGAGGSILVEASRVSILGGAVGANGGGGGGGGSLGTETVNGEPGKPGTDGTPSLIKAPGGAPAVGGGAGGEGGTGGPGARQPGPGGDPVVKGGAGGGGGSAGFIRLRSRPDMPVTVPGGTIVTPPPTLGAIERTR